LDESIKHGNIINYVKAQRLSWFGHINRMPEISIVKKIYKLDESIKHGNIINYFKAQRLSWFGHIENG
jgi:hypothetical protein